MNDKFTIIRDTREKPDHGWSFPIDAYCNGTMVEKVRTGDYTIRGLENFISIERKQSIDEFAHNCIEKRWQKCMQRMSECKHSYILFEFSQYDIDNYPKSAKVPSHVRKKLRIPPAYIRKVIYTAREDYGIHVLCCGDALNAEKIAYRLLKKAHELYLRC